MTKYGEITRQLLTKEVDKLRNLDFHKLATWATSQDVKTLEINDVQIEIQVVWEIKRNIKYE